LSLTTTVAAQQNYPIVDVVYFDATNHQDLVYTGTLSYNGYSRVEIRDLPMAYHFYINGMHLEFSITYDDAMYYFFRSNTKGYYDLGVNFYDGYRIASGFIRIIKT
jgi:hypothetical protein